MVAEWFFIALIVAAFLWLMVETKWLTLRIYVGNLDLKQLLPIIVLAGIVIVGILKGLFTKCPIHGTTYNSNYECPDCMKEQDAAQDAKREEQECLE